MSKHAQERGIIIMSVIAPEEVKENPICPSWRQSAHRHCPLLVERSHLYYLENPQHPLRDGSHCFVFSGGDWVYHHPVQLYVQQQLCGRHEQETHPHHHDFRNQGVSVLLFSVPGKKHQHHLFTICHGVGGGGCAPPKIAIYTNIACSGLCLLPGCTVN